MSTNIFIYLERQEHGSWIFEGERTENFNYDPEDLRDQPEYGLEPVFFGPHAPLHYLMGYPITTILDGPSPPFGRRGLPQDISSELGRWASTGGRNHFHGWATARELISFDWNAMTAVRMVVERKHLKYYQDRIEHSVASGTAIDWSNVRSLGAVTPRDWPSLAPDIFADITWSASYETIAGSDFMNTVVQTLVHRYGPSDRARIVYWFN